MSEAFKIDPPTFGKGPVGRDSPRLEGRAKVTGGARYPADMPVENPAYAVLVTSAVARGRVSGFDLQAARAVPGFLTVLTHENCKGRIALVKFFGQGGPAATSLPPLQSDEIHHDGEIVALVVADSFEAASEAAHLLAPRYEAAEAVATMAQSDDRKGEEDVSGGDADKALGEAAVTIEADYATPTQHHNAIELYSTTCFWKNGKLTVYEPSQFVYGLRECLATQLGIDHDDVEVVSSYVGGAFGSKAAATPRSVLVALAARDLERPVKLVATRAQGYTISSFRAETKHHITLGADRDGRLKGYRHEGWELTSRLDDWKVGGVDSTVRMYNAPDVWTKVNVVRADRNTPGFMRSPAEVPYMYAFECAVDELAVKLGMDPVELRRLNDTDREPIDGVPYTSRSLMQCYDRAAEAFGWSERNPEPGSHGDGDWHIGWGCATACYPTEMTPAIARVTLRRDGTALVEAAAHDIGTGAYTVAQLMAADLLGLPQEQVEVKLGDSRLPPGPIAGGSMTTASLSSVIIRACQGLRRRLGEAVAGEGGPLSGADPDRLQMTGGGIGAPDGRSCKLTEAFERLQRDSLDEQAAWAPEGLGEEAIEGLWNAQLAMDGGPGDKKVMFAFGAEFVEVRVHKRTGEIRVPRVVGAFAAGRIVNPRTAHSQLMGGIIWGLGSALHEATEVDERTARYVNADLSEYYIPVNADIADIEVIFVPEEDDQVNPAGVKGLGELGNVGTAAAVANAVYHATGKRIRDLPIRLEKLI